MQPYLSIVAPSRNDDHGGGLLRRMQIFVTALMEQCKKHGVSAELILVEWNPPAQRPRLVGALDLPPAVRVIEVPAAIHQRYRHAEALPLHQMIAKNVGIRRARGQFVLATNIDLLFSDELMQFIAERRLESNRMYRIDRSDVMKDVPDAPLEEQLAWCRSHMIRIHAAGGTSTVTPDGGFTFEDIDIASKDSGLKLGEGWFARELQGTTPFRWLDHDAEIIVESPAKALAIDIAANEAVTLEVEFPRLTSGAGPFVFQIDGRRVIHIPLPGAPVLLRLKTKNVVRKVEGEPRPLNMCVRRLSLGQPQTDSSAFWALRKKIGRMIYPAPRYAEVAPDFLHLQACGDFTLMAHERWFDLRGYPEFDIYPMNLDSVLCWAAHYGGAKELVLKAPMRAYHIEHESGTGSGVETLFARLKVKGVPWLDQSEMLRWGFEMARANSPKMFNGEDWGLGSDDLKETQRPA